MSDIIKTLIPLQLLPPPFTPKTLLNTTIFFQAPPPAAIEFLAKIREVIAVAKQKMAAKRFSPSLNEIAEEDHPQRPDAATAATSPGIGSRRGSTISLKRENSRRKTCTGCPGCEPHDLKSLCGRLPEFPSLVACKSCSDSVAPPPKESKEMTIQKWLQDVPSPETAEPKRLRSPRPHSPRPATARSKAPKPKAPLPPPKVLDNPPDMIHEAMVIDSKKSECPPEGIMKRVIGELERGLRGEGPEQFRFDYEADSLERNGGGVRTPTDYANVSPPSQPSPTLSAALPLDEEMTITDAVLGADDGEPEDDYELIVLENGAEAGRLYGLPELLQANKGYSLVSEVYVNNGYNYGSCPSDSNSSTLERPPASRVRYEDTPGRLTIEVEDCPDNYIRVDDSDSFEQDTLDRKPSAAQPKGVVVAGAADQILLRTSGSFKVDALTAQRAAAAPGGCLARNFGSLREIYESRARGPRSAAAPAPALTTWKFEGGILTLEERQSKRQRRSTSPRAVPPDVIPPGKDGSASVIYERPKPPRKVIIDAELLLRPPLPPKNASGRSACAKLRTSTATTASDASGEWVFGDFRKSGGGLRCENRRDFRESGNASYGPYL